LTIHLDNPTYKQVIFGQVRTYRIFIAAVAGNSTRAAVQVCAVVEKENSKKNWRRKAGSAAYQELFITQVSHQILRGGRSAGHPGFCCSQLRNDRVGLVIFAGRAYLQMPLTSDHIAAKLYVNNASPDAVPTQGTVISEALRLSNTAFNAKDKKYKAILLITDGEDHDEGALKTAKTLAENGVVINTVGVGTTTGSPILNPITSESKRDLQGNVIISRLNEQELMDIASAAGGVYQQLNDADTVVDKIIGEINAMEQKTIRDNSLLNFRSFFQWFLVVALSALTGELFISEKRKVLVS